MPQGTPCVPAVDDLPAHRHAAGLLEQGLRVAPHHEQRHQVLEQRAAPRHQRGRAVDAGQQPAQLEPVLLRDVALGDGDEAGEAGLGRQQVVVRGIEPARALGVGEPVADGEDLALPVVEEVEVHAVDEREGARARSSRRAANAPGCGAAAPSGPRRGRATSRPPRRDRRTSRLSDSNDAIACDQRGEPVGRRAPASPRRLRDHPARSSTDASAAARWRSPVLVRAAGSSARRATDRRATPAVSTRPSQTCAAACGSPASRRRPWASAISAPARLPLSTVET